ncbi:sulfotransferase family protein [Kiritimatiella glycovorans]|uniref:Sulfotransferase domain protein n=1 Tax=Kiritimatiella glycovorans TaxID=1307763 RepID=A0A0G3EJR3_9BACT|nr:sulfotransferase family protein [Kiritimatiella glycovorans]AKJ65030.1 hypothetical protein L21SP4_01793 [Kiritimatiella glycovorans]
MRIVTGMHRSGTSFITHLIQALGADCGDPDLLLERDRWNEQGYFENLEVLRLNNEMILGHLPTSMYFRVLRSGLPERLENGLRSALNIPAFLKPDPATIEKRGPRLERELRRTAGQYAGKYIKEVRFTLTLGVWRQYADIERLLLCFRHPAEVARSLQRRQHIPRRFGLWLWRLHHERFFAAAEGIPLVAVRYERFMDPDTRMDEMKRLFAFLEEPWDEERAVEATGKVLRGDLRHHVCDEEAVPEKVRDLWVRLEDIHRTHEVLRPLAES